MRENIVTLIKNCRIFSSLDRDVCETIAPLFEPMELEQDEVLFRQEDPPHYFYILTHGSLLATIVTPHGNKFVGTIKSGETVGELGAISGEPRALTIKAAEKSRLIRLSSEEFTKLCHQYPTIMMETIKPIISRSQKNIKLLSSDKQCIYIGVVVEKNDKNINIIKENFLTIIEKNLDYVFLIDSQTEEKNIQQTLSEYEKSHRIIIALLDCAESQLSQIFLQRADTFYFMIDSNASSQFEQFSQFIVSHDDYKKKIKFELILVHSEPVYFPTNSKKWLAKEAFFQCHHLRLYNREDYKRLFRFFTGNAVGLVMGGGGSRGWLHVGAIKALLEAKIPIDAIGGTSVGSIVGGCYLVAQGNYDKFFEYFNYISEKSSPPFTLFDYTIPVISIMNAQRLTNSLKTILQDHLIEDLWNPFFCISSNISTYKECAHHNGLLFEKVRASIAIPGLIPPMVIDGQLHYDGAVCNNLPVDIMRNIIGVGGKIIAISLMNHPNNMNNQYHFPPILTAKDISTKKFRLSKESYHFPPFFETFYSVLTFGVNNKEIENMAFADISIQPDLSQYGMLGVKKHQINELIKMGYREMRQALSKWRFDQDKNKLMKF